MHQVMLPSEQLDRGAMHFRQVLAVVICIALNALDGFDVLAISFASPGITEEWGISRAALGVVLAMELVGMALGSVLLGGFADKLGRKPTIQLCLMLMTFGMLAAVYANSVNQLLAVRFLTGIGIGGMLAATNAMVAEFSNSKFRHLCVILMAAGYPLGAIIGGSISSVLLETYSWRSVFVLGGVTTGLFMFVVAWLLPESVQFLASRQPKDALLRINRILLLLGKQPVSELARVVSCGQSSYRQLFSPQLVCVTLLLILAYFAQIMTFYYILKWIPKIVVDMGFHAAQAGQVLVWANVGGALGAILLGLFSSRLPLKPLLVFVCVSAFIMLSIFGIGFNSLPKLALISAGVGFFTNAGVVGLYALMAQKFPAQVRASGTGVVIGIGRGGAALSPVLAGFLFAGGFGLQFVSILMGAGALLAAASVIALAKCQSAKRNTAAN